MLTIAIHDDDHIGGIRRDSRIHWLGDVDHMGINCYANWVMERQDIAPISFGWITEPEEILPELYKKIPSIEHKFKYIFTFSDSLLNRNPNKYKLHPLAGSWCQWHKIPNKTKLCSFICSSKSTTRIQKLRCSICKSRTDFDLFGFDSWIDSKNTGLDDYMFSLVMENSIENDYFTEKLIDCFATETIPVYYGARNIRNYFNMDGIVLFEDYLSGIKLSKDLYESKKGAILENRELCRKWLDRYLIFDLMHFNLLQRIP